MISKFLASENISIKKALSIIDKSKIKSLLIIKKDKKVLGTITDGDIRRYFLKDSNLNNSIKKACNKKFKYFRNPYSLKEIRKVILSSENNIEILPILDKNNKLIKVFTRYNLGSILKRKSTLKNLKVLILAGGKGTRLKPATTILPKPLMPIGNKSIIETIITQFSNQGILNFYVSLFYKKQFIKSYLQDLNLKLNISFFEEKKPLGTAGSLAYLKKVSGKHFFIINCDNLIIIVYENLYNFHKEKKSDLTIVGCFKKYKISYGEIVLENDSTFKKINEKPTLKLLINSGLYIMSRKIINLIKKNQYIDMDNLIRIVKNKNLRINVYPIEDNYWNDLGEWDEFHKFKKINNFDKDI
jgi:dTDP-glucose pyrophosphorylase